MTKFAETTTSLAESRADALARVRYWTVVASHVVIDLFPIMFSSLLLVLQDNLDLSKAQVAIVYALTPLFSGPPQIFFAWLGDRFDTRIFGPLGLLVGGVCICSIGFVEHFWQLIVLEMIGVMGVGAYHPIAVSLAGQLGGQAIRHSRALAVSIFFAAGMLGHSIGPYISSRTNKHYGMESLLWLTIPVIIATLALILATRGIAHRDANHRATHASFSDRERGLRWFAVCLLAVQNALRFTANVSLIVMANFWARSNITDNPEEASILSSDIMMWMTIGMGTSSLLAGRIIRTGHEKKPIVLTTLAGSFVIAMTGFLGREAGVWAILAASCVGAIGFAAVIPTCIATAQRLLPSHTGLVSSLMMGFGWGISAVSAWIVPGLFVKTQLEEVATVPTSQVDMGYVWIAGLVFVAGLICLAIPSRLLEESARASGTEGDPEHVENLTAVPEP